MNQQEKLKRAKDLTLERIKDFAADAEQIGDYSWASLEIVEGEEVWVTLSLVAKKKFDIDEAVEDYTIARELHEKKKKA